MENGPGNRRTRKTIIRSYILLVVVILSLTIPFDAVYSISTVQTKITPTNEFFTLQIGSVPQIDANYWDLVVNGLVRRPLVLTYENITALPSISLVATLKCVSGPSGTASWMGVRLRDIIDMASPNASVSKVVFYGADGYSSDLTLDEARMDDVILAYEMNGARLPADQGFPLKVVVPNNYGYKWVKWLTRIELVNYDYKGYWESRGWADDARIMIGTDWSVHAYLLSFAFILCGISLISGYNIDENSKFRGSLPGFLNKTFHAYFSGAFLVVLTGSFIYWAYTVYISRGHVFYTSHGIFAGILVALFAIAGYTGLRKEKLSRVHAQISKGGFLLYLLVMVMGFLLAYGLS